MPRSRFFRYEPDSDQVVEVEKSTVHLRPQYPIACEAMAVHPSQIAEARDWDRSNGVPTEYRGDGTPIMRDPGHYKRYRRLHGVHFRNGFES